MKAIYITYDLGIRGDYNSLYSWLDSVKALECGNNTALIRKDFEKNDHNYIYQSLKKEICDKIQISSTDRIYVTVVGSDGELKGKFLFGTRKRALWEGFSPDGNNYEDSL